VPVHLAVFLQHLQQRRHELVKFGQVDHGSGKAEPILLLP
jgi:uncharacterized protein YlbG (UPF0298 family)